ncbi:MAG: hypothetical protein EPO16_09615 [Dehalococcoidia bacterium]|nr:MAG: hypothetical protein EPO16_09615 [Dehalococcoidia bacterium]
MGHPPCSGLISAYDPVSGAGLQYSCEAEQWAGTITVHLSACTLAPGTAGRQDAVRDDRDDNGQGRIASRAGFWTALVTTLLTVVSFGMAIATPPRSGPMCALDSCVAYPYIDIVAFFPRDYFWMFPATALALVFPLLIACIHYWARNGTGPFTLAALATAGMSATLLATDYVIQLTVIQPSVLRGETDGLSLFSQYNPHGVFIALEVLGYLLMSAALALVMPAFAGRGRLGRALQWLFGAGFASAIVATGGMAVRYGHDVEYRLEIALISIAWVTLIVGGALLTVLFRRTARA